MIEEKVGSLIREEKGIIVDTNRRSHMAVFNFQMEPENLTNLEKKIKSEGQISRYILLAKKKLRPGRYAKRTYLEEKPKQKVEIEEIEKKLEEILKE